MKKSTQLFTYRYPRPAVTTVALVFVEEGNNYSVLLIRRGQEPFKGKWALPGGFVQMDELLETACKRELQEETGLTVKKMKQFKAYDAIDRDPRHRTISVVFFTSLFSKAEVKGGDDAAHAEWFSLSNLPPMAFDHEDILREFFESETF